MVTNHSTKNTPGPDGYPGEFYQTLKEEIRSILHNVFEKIEEEGTLLISFTKASITLISKLDKDITGRQHTSILTDQSS